MDILNVSEMDSEFEQKEHEGRVFAIVSKVLLNTVVNVANKFPIDPLRVDIRQCVMRIGKMGLWAPRSDGKEVLKQDISRFERFCRAAVDVT